MAKGVNENVAREALSLEPSQLLEFYLIYYAWPADQFSVLAICPAINGTNPIIFWQGQPYASLPIEASGFASRGDNSLPRPRIRLSNKDLNISKYLKVHNNLIGAKVVRKRTFAKFLDDINFQDGENPYYDLETDSTLASSTSHLIDQTYYINRRVSETKHAVEFELSTVFELDNVYIPNRNVYSSYCTFIYRGHGCRYSGDAKTNGEDDVFRDADGVEINLQNAVVRGSSWHDDVTYNKGDTVFLQIENFILRRDDETDLNKKSERLKTYYVCIEDNVTGNENYPGTSQKWQKDECTKTTQACGKRFAQVLRFGGFPGTHANQPRG
jgi:lambda family phage minor tail protein L